MLPCFSVVQILCYTVVLRKHLRLHQASDKCKIHVFVHAWICACQIKYWTRPCMKMSHAWHKRWVSYVMRAIIVRDGALQAMRTVFNVYFLVAWVLWSLLFDFTGREKELSVLSSRTYLIESRRLLLPSATDGGKKAPAAREIWPAAGKILWLPTQEMSR